MITDPDRWQQVKALLGPALELAPAERARYLEQAPADAELRRLAQSLLASYDSQSFAVVGEPEALDLSEEIGPYRLIRRLGAGGMGEVFLAEQTEPIRRTVALKLIRAGLSGAQVAARFAAEGRALARMSHPNIARIFDVGESRTGRPYVAMELVLGPRLTDYCAALRLGLCERLELFLAVCRGVQHAHQKGVIHRDLKPSNVLVATEDGQPVPKIIDFGVAKAIVAGSVDGSAVATGVTEVGQWLGTPDYMSPEQAGSRGAAVDTRSDVYSLGVVLYELLTGVQPFDPLELRRDGLAAMLATLSERDPPRMSLRVRELARRGQRPASQAARLRGDLDQIVRKTLEKNPDDRYATVAELAADLGRHLRHEPVLAGGPSSAVALRKWVRRHRVGFTTASLVLLSLVAALVATNGSRIRSLRAERAAEEAAVKAHEVTAFLLDVLKAADPSLALRPDVTLREVLDASAARVPTKLAGQPRVQAQVMLVMGQTYHALGQYAAARDLLEQALVVRRRELGEQAPEVADVLHDLGWVHADLADFGPARRLLKQAVAIRTRLFGLSSPRVASSLNLLGIALKRDGEREKARHAFERALAMYDRQSVVNPRDVAMVLDNLGLLCVEAGENAEGRTHLARALALHEQALGPHHPSLSFSLNNLAIAWSNLGDLATARELLQRAVEIDRRTYGHGHPNVGIGLVNLAEVARNDGDCRAAVPLYEEGLQTLLRHHSPDHPTVREVTRLLAQARTCSSLDSR